jgi:hypothetical protein
MKKPYPPNFVGNGFTNHRAITVSVDIVDGSNGHLLMNPLLLRNQVPNRTRLTVLLALLLGANVACAIHILILTSRQTRMKQDYAQVNSVRNGLFSMEIWKKHYENIVSKTITNLKLSPNEESTLKSEIEKVVRVMIGQADSMLTKNKPSLGSKVRKAAYKALVDVPALMKKSPQFADAVMEEITKPDSLEKIRLLALSQLDKYATTTRNDGDYGPPLSRVLQEYNAKSIYQFNVLAGPRIKSLHRHIHTAVLLMIGSAIILLMGWWLLREQAPLHKPLYIWSTALACVLLLASLSVPMIDIDARIKSIDLLLLGEPIQFTNQVLFYRSKSILEVIKILLVSSKWEAVFVGFLLLLFSVIFPLSKLVSTLLCLSGKERYQRNKWIQFFAYKSGKWSMADVMVIAIFMAYIGFNSILNDQLAGLNYSSESWQMITTNGTSLQPGFMLFVTFVLFGLALSEILKRITSRNHSIVDLNRHTLYPPPPRISILS